MLYDERAYFTNEPVQHCADWQEIRRRAVIERRNAEARAVLLNLRMPRTPTEIRQGNGNWIFL